MMNDEILDSTRETGRLTKPLFKGNTKNGQAMYKSTIMIDKHYTDKSGKRHDLSYGVPFEAYGRTAEILTKYSAKGSLVLICGHHNVSAYTDKNGIKRYPMTVVADAVHLLENKKTTEARRQNSEANQPTGQATGNDSSNSGSKNTNAPKGSKDSDSKFPF